MAKANEKIQNTAYTKEQILISKKYENRRDVLGALLEDKKYTFEEVDSLINKFMKGKVN